MKKNKFLAVLLVVCILFSSTATITTSAANFSDISGHWGEYYINRMADANIVAGDSPTKFLPDANTTRAQVVVFLGRLQGISVNNNVSTKFTDVPSGRYYTGYVAWAVNNNFVSGTSSTTFSPDKAITRQQFAVIVYRYINKYLSSKIPNNLPTPYYSDKSSIGSNYLAAVERLGRAGIMLGDNNKFNPTNSLTRAQVATVLCKIYALKRFGSGIFTTTMESAAKTNKEAFSKKYNTMDLVQKTAMADYLNQMYALAQAGATAKSKDWPNASKLLKHYLDISGTKYTTFPVKTVLTSLNDNDPDKAKTNYNYLINDIILAAQCYGTGKTFSLSYEDTFTTEYMASDIFNSLGLTRLATQTASITKSGSRYTAKVKIYLKDFYDWQENSVDNDCDYDKMSQNLLGVAASVLYTFNYAGRAKGFDNENYVTATITWTSGQYYGKGASVTLS